MAVAKVGRAKRRANAEGKNTQPRSKSMSMMTAIDTASATELQPSLDSIIPTAAIISSLRMKNMSGFIDDDFVRDFTWVIFSQALAEAQSLTGDYEVSIEGAALALLEMGAFADTLPHFQKGELLQDNPTTRLVTKAIEITKTKLARERGMHEKLDETRPLWTGLADLSSGRTVEDAVRLLNIVRKFGPAEYAIEWLLELEDFNGFAGTNYTRAGRREIMAGIPCDPQMEERRRRLDLLCDHARRTRGARKAIMDLCEARGRMTDNRDADIREVAASVRAFVAAGGRIMINPEGELDHQINHKRVLDGDIAVIAASKRFLVMLRRHRNWKPTRRFVRHLGLLTSNGWTVLGGHARA